MATVNLTPPKLTLFGILGFWKHVSRKPGQGPNGTCWEWQQTRDIGGYGHATVNGRHLKASRFAFFLANKYWPSEFVLHKCDNRACCNPDHLFEGTHQQNSDDAKEKGRLPTGNNHWTKVQPDRVPKGSHRSQTKLTEEMVQDIKVSVGSGTTQTVMAAKYGVSKSLVSRVMTGLNWTHVKPPLV